MSVVQSTSPHYWFLASLDSARQQLALHGPELLGRALELARYVRREINAIQGLSSFGRDIVDGSIVTGFDETKITIDFPASASTASKRKKNCESRASKSN